MIFHENKNDFKEIIALVSERMKIREVYLEKDYWITYVLKKLSSSKFSENVVFKGGTSLSKAYGLIERFSEDIDLALLLDNKKTSNQIKRIIKDIELELMAFPFVADHNNPVTSKGSKFRKTANKYPRIVDSLEFGNASDSLILEINSFANPSPYKKMKISWICSEFIKNADSSLIDMYQLHDFELNVLDIKRTFAEKIMGLIRAGYDTNPIESLEKKIRHIYDLHKILSLNEIKNMDDNEFNLIIGKVKADDLKNQEFQGDWIEQNYSDSPLFLDPVNTLKKIWPSYENQFSSLVYGELPSLDNITNSMVFIKTKLLSMKIE
jgi:predicted nucleotidyltransferase component of viral defense system